jgi:uncharacterized protein YijF (DUF1287 family)
MAPRSEEEFEVGDLVTERFPAGTRRTGQIIKLYQFEGQQRCVVDFGQSAEDVFFAYELILVIRPSEFGL